MSNETCPRCGAKKKNTFYDSRYECDGVASISEKCHVRSMENLKAANSKEHKILGKNPTYVLIDLAEQAKEYALNEARKNTSLDREIGLKLYADAYNNKFAELIVRECIEKIETHRIPVGNSPSGELACEWTYDALKCVRDKIKEHFEIE